MKRFLAIFGRSALAGVIFAVTFCAGVALILGGAAWWFFRDVGPLSSMNDAEPDDEGVPFVERYVAGSVDENAAKVVKVELTGEIGPPPPSPVGDLLNGALGAGGSGTDSFHATRERIHLATDEKDVRGLCLVIDSPGGDLTDSDLLWHDVQLFREAQPDRFVFVQVLGQCCSGGYYVAAAADFVMVLPTSVVGSIGIISDYGYNVSDLARHFGVSNVVVTTGEHKDALNPFKPVDPRQIAIEQGLIDSQFKRFVQVVAEGRKLSVEKVRELADGRAYAAEDAVKKGLADAVGYEEDVMAKLRELAGGDVCVVAYDAPPAREENFLKKLFGGKSNGSSAPSARRRHRGLSVPRLRLVR